jgi:drug/metabolite transporter (DMT)-like permease
VRFRQVALLTTGVVAVSFSAIFIRLAHAPSLTIALYRNAFAAAVMLPLAIVKRPYEFRVLTRRQVAIAVASGGVLAVHFATWISSLSYTTIAASVVLVTASPILVAAAERALFGERTSGRAMAGILVGLAGVAIISGGDLFVLSSRAAGGDLLALAGAAAAGAYFVAGRTLRQEVSLLTYAGIVYATCALLLLPMAALSGARLIGFPMKTWGWFVLMALIPHSLGHTVFNYLLGQVRATVIAVAVMGEPVGATLLALAIFGETPPWTAIVGGVLVLGGIYVALTAQGGRRRAADDGVAPLG